MHPSCVACLRLGREGLDWTTGGKLLGLSTAVPMVPEDCPSVGPIFCLSMNITHAFQIWSHMSAKVWRGRIYMGKFDGPNVKPHWLWTNHQFIQPLLDEGGRMSKEERKSCTGPALVRRYVDSSGKKRVVGTVFLKSSQLLGLNSKLFFGCCLYCLWHANLSLSVTFDMDLLVCFKTYEVRVFALR